MSVPLEQHPNPDSEQTLPNNSPPSLALRSEDLLSVMYHELRTLARARLRGVGGPHTLQPTALVHEAYLRLAGTDPDVCWSSRGHFFGAAAEAMRLVLIDHARRKYALKRGGGRSRTELDNLAAPDPVESPLLVNECVERLEREDPVLALILKLRYFGGLSREETAAAVGLPPRTLDRRWRYIVAVVRASCVDEPD